MSLPTNVLQTVQTYQRAEMAWMLNSFCSIYLSNKKFVNFQDKVANLGDTATFDLAPRYVTYNGLIITQQPSTQRVQSLTCSQAANTSAGYTDQQFIFNVQDYMDRFGMAGMKELGTAVESDINRNFISGVTINDPQNSNYGQVQTGSGPYRFYGDGVTAINSYGQLAQMIANFQDYGASDIKLCGILPSVDIPAIVNSGLSQFVTRRNEETAMSWMLGEFAGCEWYKSNLLPIHTAGTVGDATAPSNVLTVVSTNDPSGQNITQITFSGATNSDANAIKSGDLFEFNDGVSGKPNMRFLTFIGHKPCAQSVQFRATADAGADGSGNVIINIYPALTSAAGLANQNLNNAIQAGMKVTVMPSHRAGCLSSGNALYLAMPKLPDESPYTTVTQTDKNSGISIRHYFGSQFGQNVRAYVRDVIWGSTLVPENSMRILFPL